MPHRRLPSFVVAFPHFPSVNGRVSIITWLYCNLQLACAVVKPIAPRNPHACSTPHLARAVAQLGFQGWLVSHTIDMQLCGYVLCSLSRCSVSVISRH